MISPSALFYCHSLTVLVDQSYVQVGSGTDPVEGAALARAILDKLAGTAALTVATTHHAGGLGVEGFFCREDL